MPVVAGRKYLVKKATTTIAAVRTKTVSMSRSPIDITTDDEGSVITLLDGAGNAASEQVTITLSGLAKENVLRSLGLETGTDALLSDITFTFADTSPVEVLSGNFFITSYEESGEYQGAATFSCTMVSSGAVAIA